MKQTAVEFLIDTWVKTGTLKGEDMFQATQIEKEQIIESWDNGFANGYDLGKHDDQPNPDDAQQYYNETFKSE